MLNPERNTVAMSAEGQYPLDSYCLEIQLCDEITSVVSNACFYKTIPTTWGSGRGVEFQPEEQDEAAALLIETGRFPNIITNTPGMRISVPEEYSEEIQERMNERGFVESVYI